MAARPVVVVGIGVRVAGMEVGQVIDKDQITRLGIKAKTVFRGKGGERVEGPPLGAR